MGFDTDLSNTLTQRISQMLGPPHSETVKLRRWIAGPFELAMDLQYGPSLWVEARWSWDSPLLRHTEVEFYGLKQTRHSNLMAAFNVLGVEPVYHIYPTARNIDAVMAYLDECYRRSQAGP